MKLRYRVQVTPNRRGWANTRACPSFVFKGTLARVSKTLSTRTVRLKSTANLVHAVFHWLEVTQETGIFAEKIKRPGGWCKIVLGSKFFFRKLLLEEAVCIES